VTYRAALLTSPRCLEISDIAEPALAADDVLVRIRSANLCPTDVKKWQDESLAPLLGSAPLALGHEIAGVVERVGAGVSDVKPGARVAIDPILPCGACAACAAGRPAACTDVSGVGAAAGAPDRNARLYAERGVGGGFAELVKVPRTALIELPDDLSFAAASLIEPLADVMHGIEAGGAVEHRRCVVYGLGPMGLLHVQALVHLGAHVIGADPRADRRATALAFGVHSAVAPEKVPVVDRAYVVAGGAGLVSAANAALAALDVHGAIVLFASGPTGCVLPLDANRLHYMRQRVVGVVGFEPRHATAAMQLLRAGAIDVDALRSPRIDLDGIQAAFESIGEPHVLKPAIDFPEQ
jgi:threonine dehydrogenase-like Zn-dependent dehydrogenase